MSRICRNTQSLLQAVFVAALTLVIAGCANTGLIDRSATGRVAPDSQQLGPEYVRNLPKSRTGNMKEYTVFGQRYTVLDSAAGFSEEGMASWYGKKFHGRKTSSGEIYDMHAMTAAHKHLPLPTYVRVVNLENNQSVVVKVNDRGPFIGDRIIDLSFAAATQLDMKEQGTANVYIEALSTHLVAENDNTSNKGVVASFGKEADQKIASKSDSAAPEVIEPTLAAVPLQPSAAAIEQFELEVEPNTKVEHALNANTVNAIDNSDEGFVELVANPATALNTVPAVKQPIEVQENVSVEQPALVNASAGNSRNYFIQIGAFGYAPNAEALINDVVQKIGFTAFIEKDENDELYRVKMGPFKKGDRLDTAMTELASIGIDGFTKLAAKP